MQNILVPTDFSGNAFHALRYATELLKDEQCTFYLLNVYGITKGFKNKPAARGGDQMSRKLGEISEARLKTTLEQIKKHSGYAKHTYRLISEPSDLTQSVQMLSDELNIDLIVLGNKGETSSIPLFLGSNTAKTLASVKKCPILTVPKTARIDVPGEIAFATDFKNDYSSKILDAIRTLAQLGESAVRIVYIDEREDLDTFQKANLDRLLNHLDPVGYSVDRVPQFVSKTKIIQMFMQNSSIDMLVMVQNEHGELEKMLREPVVEKMVEKIDIPFFIVPTAF